METKVVQQLRFNCFTSARKLCGGIFEVLAFMNAHCGSYVVNSMCVRVSQIAKLLPGLHFMFDTIFTVLTFCYQVPSC